MITINHNHPSSDLGEVVTIYPRCGAPDPQSGSWSQFLGDFGRRNGGINTAEIFQNHRNISPSDDYGYKAIVISPSSIT